MKKLLIVIAILIIGVCSSCGGSRNTFSSIVDYDRMLFSNGEFTTLISKYKFSDIVIWDSVQDGFGLLCGNVYVRDAQREFCGTDSLEKANIKSNILDFPHLIIPVLNIDQKIVDGIFNVEVPAGTYDIILISDGFYPIHLKWEIKSRHKYSIDFYMGCTLLH